MSTMRQLVLACAALALAALPTRAEAQSVPAPKATRPPADSAGSNGRNGPAAVTPASGTAPKSKPAAPAGAEPPGEQRPRPEGQALRVDNLDPKLVPILTDWERNSSQVLRLTGEFQRFTYDHTFHQELRGSGRFDYERPDKGLYEVEAVSVQGIKPNAKLNYELKPAPEETWICNGIDVIRLDPAAKQYEETRIPPESRGENIMDGPLPFLLGMKADQAKRRYTLNLIKQDEREVRIRVLPKWQQDAVNWREALVILDVKTYLPLAVKLTDPTGQKDTVHTFQNLKANERPGLLQRNPFKPNLAGYKKVDLNTAQSAPSEAGGGKPDKAPKGQKPQAAVDSPATASDHPAVSPTAKRPSRTDRTQ